MIKTRKDLKEYIRQDNINYLKKTRKERFIGMLVKYPDYKIYRFKKYLRKAEYYFNKGNKISFIFALFYEYKKNKTGNEINIEIEPNCVGPGLEIYHYGIVINPKAKIGKNCKLHGHNCIGNNGRTQDVPEIGDNFDLGIGASVIGGVSIGNDVVVGANAVVVKSFSDNSVLVGIPAKKLGNE